MTRSARFRQWVLGAALVSLVVAGCGHTDQPTSNAGPSTTATIGPSTAASGTPAPQATPTAAPTTSPGGGSGDSPPPTASTSVGSPQAGTTGGSTPGAPLAAADPTGGAPVALDQVVPQAGERGQRYLAALRAAGLPEVGLDPQEVLFAQGTCQALATGTTRQAALAEFATVAQAYSHTTGLPADRVAALFVDTAQQHYC